MFECMALRLIISSLPRISVSNTDIRGYPYPKLGLRYVGRLFLKLLTPPSVGFAACGLGLKVQGVDVTGRERRR